MDITAIRNEVILDLADSFIEVCAAARPKPNAGEVYAALQCARITLLRATGLDEEAQLRVEEYAAELLLKRKV